MLTGFHPARNGETDLDLVDNIQRILLSRGEKCRDEMLIQAMSRGYCWGRCVAAISAERHVDRPLGFPDLDIQDSLTRTELPLLFHKLGHVLFVHDEGARVHAARDW